jgi:hypothetical protein
MMKSWNDPHGSPWATATSEGRHIFVDSEAVYIRWTQVSDRVKDLETSKLDVIERFPSTYEGWHRIFDAIEELTSIEDAVRDDWECATSFLRKWEGPLHPLQRKFDLDDTYEVEEVYYSDRLEERYNDEVISHSLWESYERFWKDEAYEVEREARAALNILLNDFLQWLKSSRKGQMTINGLIKGDNHLCVWDGWKPTYGIASDTFRVWDTEGVIDQYLEEVC